MLLRPWRHVASSGKSLDLAKVISMIEEVVYVLQEDKADDDNKKTYGVTGLDWAEDEFKSLASDIKNHKSAIADLTEQVSTTVERLTEVVKAISSERVSEHIVGKLRVCQCLKPWMCPFRRHRNNDVVKVIASQRILERTVQQIVDLPATKISKETVEMIQSVPKEQIQEHIGEETMEEMPEVDQTGLSRTTSSAHRGKTIEVPASSSLLLDGKKLESTTKVRLHLGDKDERSKLEELKAGIEPLMTLIKKVLGCVVWCCVWCVFSAGKKGSKRKSTEENKNDKSRAKPRIR